MVKNSKAFTGAFTPTLKDFTEDDFRWAKIELHTQELIERVDILKACNRYLLRWDEFHQSIKPPKIDKIKKYAVKLAEELNDYKTQTSSWGAGFWLWREFKIHATSNWPRANFRNFELVLAQLAEMDADSLAGRETNAAYLHWNLILELADLFEEHNELVVTDFDDKPSSFVSFVAAILNELKQAERFSQSTEPANVRKTIAAAFKHTNRSTGSKEAKTEKLVP